MAIPAKTRAALRVRAHDTCERCGERFANNAHHRKNRSQGGRDELSNLLLLCGSGTTLCHGYITEHPTDSYNNGWSVRRSADPRLIPVFYRGRWVHLDNAGAVEVTEVSA